VLHLMIVPRHLPPVHSPVPAAALAAGVAALLSNSSCSRAEARLLAWIQATWAPAMVRLTNSGTTALRLALQLAGGSRHDCRVALPGWGCYDLATACDGVAADVILYDLDPLTLGPDWESLRAALAGGAGTVVVAHFGGVPIDLGPVTELAAEFGALVIEDAAQGVGGHYDGRPLGGFGACSVLSFGRGKGRSAGGGGALLVHDHALVEAAKALDLGPGRAGIGGLLKSALQHLLARPSWYWIPAGLPFLGLGQTIYHAVSPARGMSRSGLGLLAGALDESDREVPARMAVARALLAATPDRWRGGLPRVPPRGEAGWLRVPVVAPEEAEARRVASMGAHLGISPGYPLALADLPGFGQRAGRRDTPGAQLLARRLVTLPAHRFVGPGDVADIARLLAE
jgi:dTDP-4-amino-4,6-dideoxygalactose transaminase